MFLECPIYRLGWQDKIKYFLIRNLILLTRKPRLPKRMEAGREIKPFSVSKSFDNICVQLTWRMAMISALLWRFTWCEHDTLSKYAWKILTYVHLKLNHWRRVTSQRANKHVKDSVATVWRSQAKGTMDKELEHHSIKYFKYFLVMLQIVHWCKKKMPTEPMQRNLLALYKKKPLPSRVFWLCKSS